MSEEKEKKEVLILGARGKLGRALVRKFGASAATLTRGDLSFTDLPALRKTLYTLEPRKIINASAMTGLELCEQLPAEALVINAAVPMAIASIAKETGALFVHFSTDYVFTGDRDHPLTEEDQPRPVSSYGSSKHLGEEVIRDIDPFHLIFRLGSLYDDSFQGAMGFISQAIDGEGTPENPIRVLKQRSNPTSVDHVADLVYNILQIKLKEGQWREHSGVYHMATSTPMWKADFARQVLERVMVGSKVPVIAEGQLAIPRPVHVGMSIHKLVSTFQLSGRSAMFDAECFLKPHISNIRKKLDLSPLSKGEPSDVEWNPSHGFVTPK